MQRVSDELLRRIAADSVRLHAVSQQETNAGASFGRSESDDGVDFVRFTLAWLDRLVGFDASVQRGKCRSSTSS